MARGSIFDLLSERVLILDGSMGALLQRRSLPAGYAPDLWNIERPDQIEAVHTAYAEAGADILLSNTFGSSEPRLAEYGAQGELERINRAGVALARRAAAKFEGVRPIYVGGDVGPLGLILEPAGELRFDDAVELFRRQMKVLVDEGVDLIAIETMFDLIEMKAAIVAANEIADRPALLASMTFNDSSLTDSGVSPESVALTLENLGASIIGLNCSTGPGTMVETTRRLAESTSLPIAAQPNAGLPINRGSETVYEMGAAELADYAPKFVDAGASIVGGCCGSTPEYIAMIAQRLRSQRGRSRPSGARIFSISSGLRRLSFGSQLPFGRIGERINPAGRRAFSSSLEAGRIEQALLAAREQELSGEVDALDVNVGAPLVDEAKMMALLVPALQNMTTAPLSLDSSSIDALEAGARLYCGAPLLNSINGERERLESITPIIKRHGAAVVALLSADEIPERAIDRVKIAESIALYLQDHGINADRIIVDCLALAVSAAQFGARQTLETIRMVKRDLGLPTMLGLSNVSFGAPERALINNTFLAMAIGAGLDAAILNPLDESIARTIAASSLFAGRDEGLRAFLARDAATRGKKSELTQGESKKSASSTLEKIGEAIIEGARDSIDELIDSALAEGADALFIFKDVMTPAIRELGELFAAREKFIPHLVAAAETMRRGAMKLDPHIKAAAKETESKGTIVFATVKGDVHDIGKNICVTMLRNFGFEVIDLGKNVPVETIISIASERDADIIALSALMTTTMTQMKIVIDELGRVGDKRKVMVGGAVVTRAFAESIGADSYVKDVGGVAAAAEALMEIGR